MAKSAGWAERNPENPANPENPDSDKTPKRGYSAHPDYNKTTIQEIPHCKTNR